MACKELLPLTKSDASIAKKKSRCTGNQDTTDIVVNASGVTQTGQNNSSDSKQNIIFVEITFVIMVLNLKR